MSEFPMHDDRDTPRWAAAVFWAVFAIFLIGVWLTGGGCYSPELDRMIECPPEDVGD